MTKHRKIPLEWWNIDTQSLINQIVLFKSPSPSWCEGKEFTQIFLIKDTEYSREEKLHSLFGELIASDIHPVWKENGKLNDVYLPDITEYRIVPLEELPMYIGMKYTSPLLAQLIKGE